jgi:hypothetical protein
VERSEVHGLVPEGVSTALIRGAGLSLAAMMLPQVWVAVAALIELGTRTRPTEGIWFLDFATYWWSRCAFAASHLWLLGFLWSVRERGLRVPFDRALLACVGGEIAIVWSAVVWVALLGWGFPLF